MDVDKYLRICYELGEEPDPAKMPPDLSDFPEEVQVAFFVSGFLPDRWDGASGSYLGKDYSILEYLFSLYKVDDPVITLYYIKLYDNIVQQDRAERAEKRRKRAEKKSSAGGEKNFTHNVKG
jgi:hypothetical protein|tara:strand:+ start:466 stop:831 length:366 start_codon:yes stop_codon:yes gene_type:complete